MVAPWLLLGWLFHSCSMDTPWMAAPCMAAYSEQVKKCCLFCWLQASQEILIILLTLSNSRYAGYFADFEHFKNLPYSRTPLEETGCLSNFLGYLSMLPALHPSQICEGLHQLWALLQLLSVAYFSTINPKNNGENCFQYALIIALNLILNLLLISLTGKE